MGGDTAPTVVATEAALAEARAPAYRARFARAFPVGGLLRRQLPDVWLPGRAAAGSRTTSCSATSAAALHRLGAERRWRRPRFLLDVVPDAGTGFSLEGLHDLHFAVCASGRRRAARSRAPDRVTKVEEYRQELRRLAEWEPFLLGQSALPGANLGKTRRPSPRRRTRRRTALGGHQPGYGAVRQHRRVSPGLWRDGLGRLLADSDHPYSLTSAGSPATRASGCERPSRSRSNASAMDFPALLTEMQR